MKSIDEHYHFVIFCTSNLNAYCFAFQNIIKVKKEIKKYSNILLKPLAFYRINDIIICAWPDSSVDRATAF